MFFGVESCQVQYDIGEQISFEEIKEQLVGNEGSVVLDEIGKSGDEILDKDQVGEVLGGFQFFDDEVGWGFEKIVSDEQN